LRRIRLHRQWRLISAGLGDPAGRRAGATGAIEAMGRSATGSSPAKSGMDALIAFGLRRERFASAIPLPEG
jgi:hypothetical protein